MVMSVERKTSLKLKGKVVVMTGAISEMGQRLAEELIDHGSYLVFAAADEGEMQELLDKLIKKSPHIVGVLVGMNKLKDFEELKDTALAVFGHIDYWLNLETEMVYDSLQDIDLKMEKKIFDLNFWSSRLGSHVALNYFKKHPELENVLLNLGPEVGSQVQPLLGMYTTAKTAVAKFTLALRAQLLNDSEHIQICLVRPTHNHVDTVAAIISCLVEPRGEVVAGGAYRLGTIIENFFPRLNDILIEHRVKENNDGLDGNEDYSKLNLLNSIQQHFRKVPEINKG